MWDIILGAISILVGVISILVGVIFLVLAMGFSLSDIKEAKSIKKKWGAFFKFVFDDFWGLAYGLVFGIGFTLIFYGIHKF